MNNREGLCVRKSNLIFGAMKIPFGKYFLASVLMSKRRKKKQSVQDKTETEDNK